MLWASDGAMGRMYDVLAIWKETYGTKVSGAALTGGHNLQEANPTGVLGELLPFLSGARVATRRLLRICLEIR